MRRFLKLFKNYNFRQRTKLSTIREYSKFKKRSFPFKNRAFPYTILEIINVKIILHL